MHKPIDEYIITVVIFFKTEKNSNTNIEYNNFLYLDNTNIDYFQFDENTGLVEYKETKIFYNNDIKYNLIFNYNDNYIFNVLSKNKEVYTDIYVDLYNRTGQSLSCANYYGMLESFNENTLYFNLSKKIELGSSSNLYNSKIKNIFKNSKIIWNRNKKIFKVLNP